MSAADPTLTTKSVAEGKREWLYDCENSPTKESTDAAATLFRTARARLATPMAIPSGAKRIALRTMSRNVTGPETNGIQATLSQCG
jgi:hypothetical protein